MSEHWLCRWCEFRQPSEVTTAQEEIIEIRDELTGGEPDQGVMISGFFETTVQSLTEQLNAIEGALTAFRRRA